MPDQGLTKLLFDIESGKRDLKRFKKIVTDFAGHNDVEKLVATGHLISEYKHFDTKCEVLSVYEQTVAEVMFRVSPEQQRQLLDGYGKALFAFDELNVFPLCDLAPFEDVLLTLVESDSQAVRTTAFSWLARACLADAQIIARVVPIAEERREELNKIGLSEKTDMAEFSAAGSVVKLARRRVHLRQYLIREDRVPGTSGKSVDRLIFMHATANRLEVHSWLWNELIRRNDPGEVPFVLRYALAHDTTLIGSYCYGIGSKGTEEDKRSLLEALRILNEALVRRDTREVARDVAVFGLYRMMVALHVEHVDRWDGFDGFTVDSPACSEIAEYLMREAHSFSAYRRHHIYETLRYMMIIAPETRDAIVRFAGDAHQRETPEVFGELDYPQSSILETLKKIQN